MYINNDSRTHFSEEFRKLDGRKNIDDVWWVNSIGDRRREIEKIDEEISGIQGSLVSSNNRINKINAKISRRNGNIEAIKEGLKLGVKVAGGILVISVLGAGVREGFEIWCGLMMLPAAVGISALKVQYDFKNEIVALEEDKCIEEIDQDSYERSIQELTNKKNAILGQNTRKRPTGSNEIVDRPMCSYYQLKPDGDTNDYSDEVFQVGGAKPYNWTAHKLIRRMTSQEPLVDCDEKVKTR